MLWGQNPSVFLKNYQNLRLKKRPKKCTETFKNTKTNKGLLYVGKSSSDIMLAAVKKKHRRLSQKVPPTHPVPHLKRGAQSLVLFSHFIVFHTWSGDGVNGCSSYQANTFHMYLGRFGSWLLWLGFKSFEEYLNMWFSWVQLPSFCCIPRPDFCCWNHRLLFC